MYSQKITNNILFTKWTHTPWYGLMYFEYIRQEMLWPCKKGHIYLWKMLWWCFATSCYNPLAHRAKVAKSCYSFESAREHSKFSQVPLLAILFQLHVNGLLIWNGLLPNLKLLFFQNFCLPLNFCLQLHF